MRQALQNPLLPCSLFGMGKTHAKYLGEKFFFCHPTWVYLERNCKSRATNIKGKKYNVGNKNIYPNTRHLTLKIFSYTFYGFEVSAAIPRQRQEKLVGEGDKRASDTVCNVSVTLRFRFSHSYVIS